MPSIKGGWLTPDVSGHATIRNADFHFTDFSNGLTDANGEIAFQRLAGHHPVVHARNRAAAEWM